MVLCCLVARLLDMVRESFGADAARNVMAVEPDNLPIILIVFKSKGKVEVRNVIQGLPLCVYRFIYLLCSFLLCKFVLL